MCAVGGGQTERRGDGGLPGNIASPACKFSRKVDEVYYGTIWGGERLARGEGAGWEGGGRTATGHRPAATAQSTRSQAQGACVDDNSRCADYIPSMQCWPSHLAATRVN